MSALRGEADEDQRPPERPLIAKRRLGLDILLTLSDPESWLHQSKILRGILKMSKCALVTGSTGEIGRAIALRLAGEGYDIKVTGRNAEALEESCELIRKPGNKASGFAADLCDMAAVDALAEWAVADGDLEVVVMVAGGGASTPVGPDMVSKWDEILNVILRSQMRLAAKTLPAMKKSEGIYIFLGGMLAKMAMKNSSGYSAARHGIQGFAESMFEDVREHGVRVSLIHPGFVNTKLVHSEGMDPAKMIQTEDIAELARIIHGAP